MNTTSKYIRLGIVWLWLLLTASAACAQISQKPLLSGSSSVKPNLMVMLDNSGSMLFTHAPDNFTSSFTTTIPFVSVTQSSDANKLFYDPRVRYEPRRNADNSLQANATEANASTTTYSACAGTFVNPYYGCDTITPTFNYISSFMPPAQGLARVCNSAGTICPWGWYTPTLTVTLPESLFVLKAANPTFLYSTTLTHYLCTAYNSSNKCISVKRYDVPKTDPGVGYSSYPGRTDCTGSCTWAIERQNVLNWNLYYSNRLKAVVTAVGAAFADPVQDNQFRLGYGRINSATAPFIGTDDTTTRIQRGVRPFTNNASLPALYSADKTNFFTWLYGIQAGGGTPLNGAVDDVGNYFLDRSNSGPWAADPVRGSDSSAHLECRRNSSILLSDGQFDDTTKAVGNIDSTGLLSSGTSTAYVHPDTKFTFTYNITPSKTATFVAYPDATADTLADLAFSYWIRDLRPDLPNRLSTRAGRPAFWQHLVQYTVGFSVATSVVNQASITAYQTAFLNGQTFGIDWGTSDEIADFMHAAVNTTGKFYSASNANQVKQAITGAASDSTQQAGNDGGVAVADTNGALDTLAGELKYVPRYNTIDSSGDIDAFTLDAAGNVTSPVPIWIASRQIPTPAARKLFTISGINTAVNISTSFSAMPADVQAALGAGADDSLMSYIRGNTAVLKPSGELYRLRTSLIGGMVNTAPTYVRGELNMGYTGSSVAGSSTYAAFKSNKLNNRSGIIMATANDGTLHAIDALKGTELMGFMPRTAMPKLQAFATEPYTFQYIFDGPSIEGDIYGTTSARGTGWHNIVTGTGGRGGKFVYAIEAPVPTSASGSGSAATPTVSDMLWEINDTNTNMGNLGHVLNAPISGQLRDGTWATIFGNGTFNASNQASLFIVNALTGAFIKEISTATGSAGSPNGLNGVTLIRNEDRVVVAVLAGDKLGNLWKFDLSSTTPTDWKVAFGGKALFTDPNGKTILGAPAWQKHPVRGYIAVAATGILLEDADRSDLSQKTIYGVWDKTAVGGSETASFIATLPLGTTDFLVQTSSTATSAVSGGFTYYQVSANAIDWSVHKGWKLDMNFEAGQRSISDVNNLGGSVVIASVVPPPGASAVESCSSSGTAKDYLYIVDVLSGGAAKSFDVNGDGAPDAYSVLYATTGFGRGSVIAKDYIGYRTESNISPNAVEPPCVGGSTQVTIIGTESTSVKASYKCSNTIAWRRSWRQLFNPPKMQ